MRKWRDSSLFGKDSTNHVGTWLIGNFQFPRQKRSLKKIEIRNKSRCLFQVFHHATRVDGINILIKNINRETVRARHKTPKN